MKVLVTGGAGFIGSAVIRHLIATRDCDIVNLDKLTYVSAASTLTDIERSPRYELVQGDIADPLLVERLFLQHDFHAVLHLAAETHVDRSITGAQPFIQTNVVGTFTLLQAALKHWFGMQSKRKSAFRFLHVSTDEVFGSLGPKGRFSESSRYEPRSPYSASKAAADHLVSAWGSTYGLPVLISNCSNNYGPYQFPEKLIPLAILKALEGSPIPVYGDGSQVRDWLHVDDHARALLMILENGEPGRTYNVGASNERTNIEVVRTICALAGVPERIAFVPDRPGHDRRYAIDPTRIMSELGWRPEIDWERGLAETVDWYRQRRDWWEPLRHSYDGERLGLVR